MIIYNAFMKILKTCLPMIVLYTVILIAFAGINTKSDANTSQYLADKPDIIIVDHDRTKVSDDFIAYMDKRCTIKKDIANIDDALFYRDVNMIIQIPKGFSDDLRLAEKVDVTVKSAPDYQASLAKLYLERYIKTAQIHASMASSNEEWLDGIHDTWKNVSRVHVESKVDVDTLSHIAFYFNFSSYSILAACVYVICMILNSFQKTSIQKRMLVSAVSKRKFNGILLMCNGIFALVFWGLYVLLGRCLLGAEVFSDHGMIFILNSFLFTLCAVSMAFLISNLTHDKNAVNGIVNVVALGSAFLCGAFLPMDFLPDFVLKIAHVLPSYWFIKSNELLKTMDTMDYLHMQPVYTNMVILTGFTIAFFLATNIVTFRKRKLG